MSMSWLAEARYSYVTLILTLYVCSDTYLLLNELISQNNVSDSVNATWISFSGHLYNFHTEAETWHRARYLCQMVNNSTDLVVINNQEEQQFIQGVFLEIPCQDQNL